MKKQYYFSLFLLAAIPVLWSYSSGPGLFSVAATGAPSEGTCVSCHTSNALNSGGGGIAISLGNGVTQYTPGQIYTVTVSGNGSSINKYGFQLTARKSSDNSDAGTLTAGTGTSTRFVNGHMYVEHNTTSSTGVWTVTWTAPSTDEGEVVFYVAGNSAEDPAGNTGDHIYSASSSFTAQTTTSASDIIEDRTNLVFPNPSHGNSTARFYLEEADQITAQIVDLNGRTVQEVVSGSVYASGAHNLNFSTSALEVGYYQMVIKGAKTNTVIPFVKQ